jgi:uncharacterized protein YggE
MFPVPPMRPVPLTALKRALGRVAAAIVLFVAVAPAQQGPQPAQASSMRVHGESTIAVEPDQVQFDIGVLAEAATAKAASDRSSGQSSALIHELRAAFPSATIDNINFSVNPNYRYPPSGPPAIAGYTASSTVRFLLNDISRLPTVIDIAIKSGADSINRLTFTLQDETAVRGRALAQAAKQAHSGAEALAAALEVTLGKLLSVEEGRPVIISPPREITFEKLQSTTLTPVSPGNIDVHAEVDLTYEIAPAASR